MKRRLMAMRSHGRAIVDVWYWLWDGMTQAFRLACECAAIALPLLACIYLVAAICKL